MSLLIYGIIIGILLVEVAVTTVFIARKDDTDAAFLVGGGGVLILSWLIVSAIRKAIKKSRGKK